MEDCNEWELEVEVILSTIHLSLVHVKRNTAPKITQLQYLSIYQNVGQNLLGGLKYDF